MIDQPTIQSEISYCDGIINGLKKNQPIDSSRAVLYIDTRTGFIPLRRTYTLASGANVKIRVTYTHPLARTPYCQLQYAFLDTLALNYTDYREISSNEYITEWTLVLNNNDPSSDTFDVLYGVKSSAPGLVSVVTLP